MSSNPKGLQMIERWHMVNIFYHIIELQDRDDLVELLLGNMDFTLWVYARSNIDCAKSFLGIVIHV